ncbi:hypothetical protein ACEUD4_00960 [Aeromonas media]|uniref:hypothetical protein n=1 Tax=Aeromonas media TaxID=651 RepID=UPI0038D164B7
MKEVDLYDSDFVPEIKFEHSVVGTKGAFWSAAGTVEYILTSAKLSVDEYTPSAKLTRQLYPVREILDVDKMDFDQLLQRDLDDYRVSSELIQYLLLNQQNGVSFFPPIVAALLPFRNKTPQPQFPTAEKLALEKNDGVFWAGEVYGRAFKYQSLVKPDGSDAGLNIGKISWNEAGARLVVLDGQHRAMAMLAIARTITNSWADSGGEKYKYFYENKVKSIIDELGGDSWLHKNLEKIEFPVCVIRFKHGEDHHDCARKLFVDVNQNARRPSESRIILLSDNDLLNIFTRRTLNKVRGDNVSFPISAVEYDYPGTNKKSHSTKPIKWSAIINIEMLRAVVLRLVFGPRRIIENLKSKPSGKPNWTDKNSYMLESLCLADWFPRTHDFDGVTYERNQIRKDYFPKDKLNEFIDKYESSWGEVIINVLDKLLPFSVFGSSLNELLNNWSSIDVHASLAKEAIKSGQGMFWTIKNSHDDFYEDNAGKTPSDVVSAWGAILSKKEEFHQLLSKNYLQKFETSNIDDTKKFFDIFGTYANIVGVFTAIASVVRRHGDTTHSVPALSLTIIDAINTALSIKNKKLRLFLNRDSDDSINRIKSMDTVDFVYFRYFWLEMIYLGLKAEDENSSSEILNLKFIEELVCESRSLYYTKINSMECALIKNNVSQRDWSENKQKYEMQAKEKTNKFFENALKKNFGYKVELVRELIEKIALPSSEELDENISDDIDY